MTINYVDGLLSMLIDDHGKGFNPSVWDKIAKKDSEECMYGSVFYEGAYKLYNGRPFINSIPGEGTGVTINYKVDKVVVNKPMLQ